MSLVVRINAFQRVEDVLNFGQRGMAITCRKPLDFDGVTSRHADECTAYLKARSRFRHSQCRASQSMLSLQTTLTFHISMPSSLLPLTTLPSHFTTPSLCQSIHKPNTPAHFISTLPTSCTAINLPLPHVRQQPHASLERTAKVRACPPQGNRAG
jgi:hypothetical protein